MLAIYNITTLVCIQVYNQFSYSEDCLGVEINLFFSFRQKIPNNLIKLAIVWVKTHVLNANKIKVHLHGLPVILYYNVT